MEIGVEYKRKKNQFPGDKIKPCLKRIYFKTTSIYLFSFFLQSRYFKLKPSYSLNSKQYYTLGEEIDYISIFVKNLKYLYFPV